MSLFLCSHDRTETGNKFKALDMNKGMINGVKFKTGRRVPRTIIEHSRGNVELITGCGKAGGGGKG